MMYFLAKKYGYDPFEFKINLVTGIVTPKKMIYEIEPEKREHIPVNEEKQYSPTINEDRAIPVKQVIDEPRRDEPTQPNKME
ncbi:MAG: hypothetical protein NWE89_14035, partial [Candidatus Bathyarchaeota archaeon]|nr:hypothetical protein [Candidatus Bathyarchaeota archaeon]